MVRLFILLGVNILLLVFLYLRYLPFADLLGLY